MQSRQSTIRQCIRQQPTNQTRCLTGQQTNKQFTCPAAERVAVQNKRPTNNPDVTERVALQNNGPINNPDITERVAWQDIVLTNNPDVAQHVPLQDIVQTNNPDVT